MADILPIYKAEKKDSAAAAVLPAAKEEDEERFENAKTHYHYEAQNAAFGYNVPRFDVRARLGEIKAPTLVVVGRHDPITPVEDSQEIHEGIKGSVLAVFENSGHSPPSEEPQLFQARLWEFVDKL